MPKFIPKKLYLTVTFLVFFAAFIFLERTFINDISTQSVNAKYSYTKENNTALLESKQVKQSVNTLVIPPLNGATFDLGEISDIEHQAIENTVEEADVPRLLSSYTPAGALLDDYLEEQNVAYLDSSYYPFDAQTESIVRHYANSGKILLFDNTQATENLLEFNKTSGDVVADYFGTGAESDMTVATSIELANGGIEYMVLPISISETEDDVDLSEKVKLAIELFQLEQTRKQDENVSS